MRIPKEDWETVINFNGKNKFATVYTRDPFYIKQMDMLVREYPDTFRCISESDIDKTYEMPKSAVCYRKPR